jgi:ribonuclease J
LITGTRDEPFFMVQNIIEKNDKYLEFYKTDNVIVLTPTVVGNEKISARTIDLLYRTDATINVINKSLFIDSHATIEEIKMMINILKPKYIIPVIGEYRHQYSLKNIAIDLNYSPEYVLIMENGDVFNINKNSSYLSKGDITTGEILIDGTPIDFSYDFVIRDRTLLAEDGALVIVAYVNPQTKQIVGPVDIITKGFVYVKGSEAILNGIRSIFYSASAKHLDKKYINWIEYKKDIRDTIGKYIFQETRRKPILIPDIISLENVPKNEEKN